MFPAFTFPDWHLALDAINAGLAGGERLPAMAGQHSDFDTWFTHRDSAGCVSKADQFCAEFIPDFYGDSSKGGECELFMGFIFKGKQSAVFGVAFRSAAPDEDRLRSTGLRVNPRKRFGERKRARMEFADDGGGVMHMRIVDSA